MKQLVVVPGATAVADDRVVIIVQVNASGQVQVRDLATGAVSTTPASALRQLPVLARKRLDLTGLEQTSDADWQRARDREKAVQQLQASADVKAEAGRIAGLMGVSERTVFRWLAAYRKTLSTSALLPARAGAPAGASRLNPQIEGVIEEVIRDVYLTKTRAKKEEVVRQVGLRCAHRRLAAPSRKPILARLRALDAMEVAKARLQPKEVAALFETVPGSYRVERALEVVQIDHTRVDVVVVDDEHRLPIGRPWLTLAVDVCTRMVTGFYLSLDSPSSTSVALCLTHTVMPKDLWLKARGLTCSWPVWGIPQSIHADNGPDFTSAALQRGCDEHGMTLILRPVRQPRYGGHIERLIGTMMGRVHLLPGTTGSNPQDKGAYPSEAEAVMTLGELERWLAIEICDQYHHRVHRSLGRRPAAAWSEAMRIAFAGLGALPGDIEQFTVSFLPFEMRKLRRDGLHLFNIRYWDPVLPVLAKLGETMVVRYDPRNLSKVYVQSRDGNYVPIAYADIALPPISLWEQRSAVARMREAANCQVTQAAMFEAVLEQRALIEQASGKTKVARRSAQRQKDRASATAPSRAGPPVPPVDYDKPVQPFEGEIWEQ